MKELLIPYKNQKIVLKTEKEAKKDAAKSY